jgi:imidazolonepropionase-like amidohydrolase
VDKTIAAEGATQIDLKGQHLYPGLILLDTALGLTEIEAVRATADAAEVGEFTPDVESWVSVNPDSELIPVARANGIAYFEPAPQGGIVSGQSGLVAVDGWTTEKMTLKTGLALHLIWPAMDLETRPKERNRSRTKPKSLEEQAKERRTKVQSVTDFIEEAKAYAKAKDAASHGKASPPERVPAWEAMLPYVRGERPIVVHANEVRQIKAAVVWAVTNDLKMIIAGGRDAWMVAGLLAARQIPVIYEHTYTQPSRDIDPYDVHFRAAEVLHQAGVKVVFSLGPGAFDAPLVRNVPYSAAQAVAFGLPESEAIKGLTLYPAQLAGVADRLGSIDPGKEATLVVADGDILDNRTQVKRLWLAGREVSLESKHTRLYEKYRSRPIEPQPLTNVHAHNDYEHKRPLFDALDHGFCSVEADVHLVEGQLLVAHDRSQVKRDRTLETLYLDPLRDRVKKNGGRVFPDGPEVILLIDVKGDWHAIYPVLRDKLEQYKDILSTFHDGSKQTNAILAIITGNRSKTMFDGERVRYAALDGALADLDSNEPADLIPWISSDWTQTFKWRAVGSFPDAEKLKLKEIVAKAHRQGRKVRFWGAPDNPVFWQEMLANDVDLINTDNLEGAQKFLLKLK